MSSRSGPMRSFGPGQVLQDRHRAPGPAGGVAHAAHGLGVLLERAVRVVQPRDVHPGRTIASSVSGLARGRADGGDDLGAAHRLGRYDRARRVASGAVRAARSVARGVAFRFMLGPSRPFPARRRAGAHRPLRRLRRRSARDRRARTGPALGRAATGEVLEFVLSPAARFVSAGGAHGPRLELLRGRRPGGRANRRRGSRCGAVASGRFHVGEVLRAVLAQRSRTHARSLGAGRAKARRAARAGARSARRRSSSARRGARTAARPPAARRPPGRGGCRRASGRTRAARRA